MKKETATLFGIDVSHHQGKIDWEKVKESGVEFAIIRAGFGNVISQKDTYFDVNMENALKAGIPVGAYWFSYAVDAKDALKEAEVCHSVLKKWKDKLSYPVFFDFEYDSEEYNSEITYNRQGRTDIIRAFCEAMKGYGYSVGYYTNKDYIVNRIDKSQLPYDLWLTDYTGEPDYPCAIQQTSSTGSVPGISGNVDTCTAYKAYVTTPAPAPSVSAFKPGDKVKVLNNQLYGGGKFTVYYDTYDVIQVSGDRVVIGIGSIITAAVNEKNLAKVSGVPAAPALKAGDKVKVLKNRLYDGGEFTVYYSSYDVIQVSGDRAVIGVGDIVTAAVNVKDLQKV